MEQSEVLYKWVKAEYEKLFDLVKSGERIAAYVDYDFYGTGSEFDRDITTITNHVWIFNARGIGYSKYFSSEPTKTEFVKVCENINVEWLKPVQSEIELLKK